MKQTKQAKEVIDLWSLNLVDVLDKTKYCSSSLDQQSTSFIGLLFKHYDHVILWVHDIIMYSSKNLEPHPSHA